jgi:hypothetical protein
LRAVRVSGWVSPKTRSVSARVRSNGGMASSSRPASVDARDHLIRPPQFQLPDQLLLHLSQNGRAGMEVSVTMNHGSDTSGTQEDALISALYRKAEQARPWLVQNCATGWPRETPGEPSARAHLHQL